MTHIRTGRRPTSNALTPLPSLIRASAQDAANMQMRKAGRKAWSEDDYNQAVETQERLIRACYARETDHNEPDRCYIRFAIAEQMEKRSEFRLNSDLSEIFRAIDEAA